MNTSVNKHDGIEKLIYDERPAYRSYKLSSGVQFTENGTVAVAVIDTDMIFSLVCYT